MGIACKDAKGVVYFSWFLQLKWINASVLKMFFSLLGGGSCMLCMSNLLNY